MHLYKFIEGKPSDSIPTLKNKIEKKQKVVKTKEDKAMLKEAEHVLLDYHRRREYDDMGDYHINLPLMSQDKFFHSFMKPMAIGSSSSASLSTSTKTNKKTIGHDGKTYVHTYQYQNINGNEKEKKENYVIDKNGKKKKLPLLLKRN